MLAPFAGNTQMRQEMSVSSLRQAADRLAPDAMFGIESRRLDPSQSRCGAWMGPASSNVASAQDEQGMLGWALDGREGAPRFSHAQLPSVVAGERAGGRVIGRWHCWARCLVGCILFCLSSSTTPAHSGIIHSHAPIPNATCSVQSLPSLLFPQPHHSHHLLPPLSFFNPPPIQSFLRHQPLRFRLFRCPLHLGNTLVFSTVNLFCGPLRERQKEEKASIDRRPTDRPTETKNTFDPLVINSHHFSRRAT